MAVAFTSMITFVAVATPAVAAPVDKKPAPQETYTEIVVSQADYNPNTGQRGDDEVVAIYTDKPGTIVLMTNGSGEYTISTPGGCKAVTMTNTSLSFPVGVVLYRFKTVTSWCWNRNNRTISDVGTSYRIEDVDSQYVWRGINTDTQILGLYAWIAGSSKSGYKHYRQGIFENCILKFGCIGTEYPSNYLWSHSNGTYAWDYDL